MRANFKRYDNYPSLSKRQLEVIEGTLLGDAHLEIHKNGRHASYRFEQTIRNREYVDHIHDFLKPFSNEVKDHIVDKTKWSKGMYELSCFKTCCHPEFTQIHSRWYKNKTKIIPQDIQLNWNKISYWFADDGCRKETTKKDMVICSQGFNFEEHKLLQKLLSDLNIKTSINRRDNLFYLRIKSESYFMFIDKIKPIVEKFKCFEHKVDVSRVSKNTNKLYSNKEKKEAMQMLNKGIDLNIVAKKIRCHPITIKRWINA